MGPTINFDFKIIMADNKSLINTGSKSTFKMHPVKISFPVYFLLILFVYFVFVFVFLQNLLIAYASKLHEELVHKSMVTIETTNAKSFISSETGYQKLHII